VIQERADDLLEEMNELNDSDGDIHDTGVADALDAVLKDNNVPSDDLALYI